MYRFLRTVVAAQRLIATPGGHRNKSTLGIISSQNVPLRTFVTTPARRGSQPARDASQKGLALYRRLRADHQTMRQELRVDHQAMRQELREGYQEMTQKLHAGHREMFRGLRKHTGLVDDAFSLRCAFESLKVLPPVFN